MPTATKKLAYYYKDGQYYEVTADLAGGGVVETTWSDLKALRDGGNLTPGAFYRITDYQCTTVSSNASSAGHQFDVIVLALETNKLAEEAWAAHHAGDTYFANSKLEAWRIWYSLDNDTTKYGWADSSSGKGVIYRMIDEFDNDLPYDFKNILFSRTGKYTNSYTFGYTENETIKDASLIGTKCSDNVMKPYFSMDAARLNFNVFYSSNSESNWFNNFLGKNCGYNTFSYGCNHNVFEEVCQNNIFGNGCRYNIIKESLSMTNFGAGCSYNTFGCSCDSIYFGTNCRFNIFEGENSEIVLGNNCSGNLFGYKTFYITNVGNYCSDNTFGNNCTEVALGTNCCYNEFGDYCRCVSFGDSSATVNYCQYNVVESGCKNLYITSSDTTASSSNQLQNVRIHAGVQGTDSSNRRTITIPDRNLAYSTDYYANGSQTVVLDD